MPAPTEIATGDGALSPFARWAATLTVMLGVMGSIMTSTMVSVAVPDVMGAYGIGQDRVHWMLTGFLSAMTVAMLLNAWFVHNLGARATYVLACVTFIAASVFGFVSPTFDGVIAARVVQGACAGLSQPLAMSVIFTAFPPRQRGLAMGVYGMGIVVGPAIGPLFGGVIVDTLAWHYVFVGALPIMGLAAVLGLRFVPGRERVGAARTRLNWLSFGLVAVAVAAFLNGISSGQREGWGSTSVLGLLAVAALAMLAFIEVEARSANPVLNVRLFADRGFAAASVVGFMFGAGMFGTIYLVPIFTQTVQGYTATKAGLLLMAAETVPLLMYPLAGWLAQRTNPGHPVTAGMIAFGVSAWLLAGADADSGFWTVVGLVALGHSGLALVVPALMAGGLRGLGRDLVAYGAGSLNFIRMLGGAIGVNTVAIVLERRTALHAEALAATQTVDNGTTQALLADVVARLAEAGLAPAERVPLALDYLKAVVVGRAEGLAFQDGFLVLALGFAIATVTSLVLLRRPS